MKLNKTIKAFFLVGVSVFFFIIIGVSADISNIQYPVLQLGNCKNETECRSYCDKPENTIACLNFAEENGLMAKEEIEMAKKFTAAGNKGPGGCTGKDSCETYCNDISHIEECVSFAEKNNLMPPDELQEAQKVRDAIKRGAKPPTCGSKKSCDSYCEDPNHMEECITFASEAGLMGGKEKEDAQKMLQALKRGVKPLPCKGKQACDAYCQQPDNMEVCMNFAIEAGFMGDQEKENAQKMLSAIKKGVKPPNCRGKEECDSYCQSDEHFEECANFAEAAGFMNAKDAEMARKTKGKGPGGCKGKEECELFCNNKDNQEICFKFAEENDMIPEEELQKMKEGMSRMREDGRRQEGMSPPGEREFRGGPGGCSTPEECQNYCSQNPEACRNFQGPKDEQRPSGPPNEFERQFPLPGSEQNQFQPPRKFREGEEPREQGQEELQNNQMPREFQQPPQEFNQPMMPNQTPIGNEIIPPPEFDRQIPVEQFQPFEPIPQVEQQPQGEIAPPPPPSESTPQSLLNNKYLGAIFRFLISN